MDGRDNCLALGLMSGTSLDGIDAALIRTDGNGSVSTGAWSTTPYDDRLRDRLRATLGGVGDVRAVERDVTLAHAAVVTALLEREDVSPDVVSVIGFHGHTIAHRPHEGLTWQIGDGARLADCTGIDVVCDLRRRDVAAGGQGAPLAPLYHAALADGLVRPLAVLNLGGVGNVTYLGEGGAISAFDTGPGCALIDDWVRRHDAGNYDADGALAALGTVDRAILAKLLDHPYIDQVPPKSLDRDDFTGDIGALSAADGAATLTAFTAAAVGLSRAHLPTPPARWLVTGGGRHNPVLMADLGHYLGVPVDPVEAVGWQGDAIESQAFAYLAVRSLRGLPVSIPETTGVPRPLTGGALYRG
ncbi:MAG: anhydro-N-acetylmuramic acid kinase [Pseudomonadota bacterium]|nr:anhydro-N-acetylmuramic acid kinase [Pseudomonadota bacterium]